MQAEWFVLCRMRIWTAKPQVHLSKGHSPSSFVLLLILNKGLCPVAFTVFVYLYVPRGITQVKFGLMLQDQDKLSSYIRVLEMNS